MGLKFNPHTLSLLRLLQIREKSLGSDPRVDDPDKQVKDEDDACYEEAYRVGLIKRDKEPQPRCHQRNGYGNNYDPLRSFCQSLGDGGWRDHQ